MSGKHTKSRWRWRRY